jgi:translation initiation factor 1
MSINKPFDQLAGQVTKKGSIEAPPPPAAGPEDELSKHVKSRNFIVKIKLDTGGRKGKTVTVLDGLPKHELFLKELVKILKKTCGAGGTYLTDGKDGVIELQGDHRDRVAQLLEKYRIQFKR